MENPAFEFTKYVATFGGKCPLLNLSIAKDMVLSAVRRFRHFATARPKEKSQAGGRQRLALFKTQ